MPSSSTTTSPIIWQAPRARPLWIPQIGCRRLASMTRGQRPPVMPISLGPLMSIGECSAIDDAFALAIEVGGGPLASVFTDSPGTAFGSGQRHDVGIRGINRPLRRRGKRAPFGGEGRSGNGSRWAGPWAVDQVTRWQTMSWRYAAS
ncbi:MAG TPA: aldehyde dehydrogenase family protein [Baekduia sp.]|nr:aldehyde dehydrogenase family protein [Baekduia sp.]